MKKPKALQIGCVNFKIHYVIPGKKGSKTPLQVGELGAVNADLGEIWLDKNMSNEKSLMTLLHEILHACADIVGGNSNPFAKEMYTRTFTTLLLHALLTAGLIKL